MRRALRPLAAFTLSLLTVSPASAAASVTVAIANFTFEPAAATVSVGTKVTWINRDDIPHVIDADDGSFASPALDTGDSFSVTVTTIGEIAYFFGLHPHMKGSIKVVAASG